MSEALLIGTMSGTSMDGIDVALISSDGEQKINPLAHEFLPYPATFQILLKAFEYSLHQHGGDLAATRKHYNQDLRRFLNRRNHLPKLDIDGQVEQLFKAFHHTTNKPVTIDDLIRRSTEWHAEAIENLLTSERLSTSKVRVVGYHGQTLYHNPEQGISFQMGDGQALANRLQIPVVNRFREQDVHHGGQGAPLAPLYHQALAIRDLHAQQLELPLVIVNCGGIANVTIITGPAPHQVFGFDTGPGNVLIDRWIQQHCTGETMDRDGNYGLQGQVHRPILDKLYHHSCLRHGRNYYELSPPKSLDSNDIVLTPELENCSFVDACATLEAFTAATIVSSVLRVCKDQEPRVWILAGGGWQNPVIKSALESYVKECSLGQPIIKSADELQWSSQHLEAQMFAYYALRHIQKKPITYPNITRVSSPMVGGFYYEPHHGV